MADDSLHNPHDKLFKSGFKDPATAAAFLSAELPACISSLVSWSDLKLQAGTFIDSQFRHTESDLLFSTTLAGKDCCVYLLFEHQSAPDPWLALRLLRYMVRIWEAHGQTHPAATKLPVILPVVFAQNAEIWHLEPRLGALLDLPQDLSAAFQPYVPDFIFRLIQLAEMDFESMRGTPTGVLILRAMKAERLNQLLHEAVWDESLMVQVPREMFEMLLRYILDADIDKTAFMHKVEAIHNPQARTNAMSLAEQFRQEGLEKGRQEGLQTGIQTGRQEGIWIGKIQVLQELMGECVSEKTDLSHSSGAELAEQFRSLQSRYNTQFKKPD